MKDDFIEGIRKAQMEAAKKEEGEKEPTITTMKGLLSAIKDSEEWQATTLAEEDERLFDIMMDPKNTQRERERAGRRRELIHRAVFGDKEVSGSTEIPEIGGGWNRESRDGSRAIEGPQGLSCMEQGKKHFRRDDTSGNNPGGAR